MLLGVKYFLEIIYTQNKRTLNENFPEKRGLLVPWTVHGAHWQTQTHNTSIETAIQTPRPRRVKWGEVRVSIKTSVKWKKESQEWLCHRVKSLVSSVCNCILWVFKYVNSAVGPSFNENFDEKRGLWVSWTVHETHWPMQTLSKLQDLDVWSEVKYR